MFNKGHCSPKALEDNDNNRCLNRKLLEKIAKILNNNPNCDNIDCNIDEDNLYDSVCSNMKKISNCNSEYCWITVQDIVKKLNNSEIDEFKEYFRPAMPEEWGDDKKAWLSTTDIDKVLEQYEDAHDDFIYLGAHPIDAHKCSVSDEVCKINVSNLLKKNKKKIGIVFNTDDSSGEGEHWVSFYVDLEGVNRNGKPSAYYFDSAADRPQKEVFKLVKKLKKQAKKEDINLDFLYNDIQHQYKESECGVYCMYFISKMLKGINFEKFVKDIKKDEYMNKYRKIFYVDVK